MVPAGARQAVNAGLDNVRFKAPVRVNARVRARVKLGSIQSKGPERTLVPAITTLEIEGEDAPALTGEISVMIFGAA